MKFLAILALAAAAIAADANANTNNGAQAAPQAQAQAAAAAADSQGWYPPPPPPCRPGSYSCTTNNNGWRICDYSGHWVYGGACSPGTRCVFNYQNGSPYCLPY
ncbi:hypothetical protein C8A03DRAFT_32175 [Achaetomium macrosporum]|uniref:Uncharacterized protein n=1 Tax=Achaetomium macrosporum TaxID=79813 RepID=A0AAN7H890_9PEZI|nr:hypothetical protein C8A03DRAFT_32175 [Achaetomium macrosporum]